MLKYFFNDTDEYLILMNTKLDIITFNEVAHTITFKLFQQKLCIGNNLLEYYSSFDREFALLCEKALKGCSINYEHFIKTRLEENEWYKFSISPVYDSSKNIIALAHRGTCINEKKLQEKIIKNQSKSLSIIAQFQSHQVRQPVSSILGIMNLIKEENYLPKKEYLVGLENATMQLDIVIQSIVTESRKINCHN